MNLSLAKSLFEALKVGIQTDSADLDSRHMDCLVRGITAVLPIKTDASGALFDELEDAVTDLLYNLLEWSYSQSIIPVIATYNIIIMAAAKLRSIHLLTWALNMIKDLNLRPDRITYFSMMTAAGSLRDPKW